MRQDSFECGRWRRLRIELQDILGGVIVTFGSSLPSKIQKIRTSLCLADDREEAQQHNSIINNNSTSANSRMSVSVFNHPTNRFNDEEWSLSDPSYPDLIAARGGAVNMKPMAPLLTCDLIESANDYHIHADLPGVDPQDLELNLHGRSLVIKAERKHVHETGTDKIHSLERSYGSVQRSIKLPHNVDFDKIQSKFKNGVLCVTLPKLTPTAPKKLEVTHE